MEDMRARRVRSAADVQELPTPGDSAALIFLQLFEPEIEYFNEQWQPRLSALHSRIRCRGRCSARPSWPCAFSASGPNPSISMNDGGGFGPGIAVIHTATRRPGCLIASGEDVLIAVRQRRLCNKCGLFKQHALAAPSRAVPAQARALASSTLRSPESEGRGQQQTRVGVGLVSCSVALFFFIARWYAYPPAVFVYT
ncbi:hypothetical protein C8F04DRAFT_1267116 [Mycena alexandri]|uniref:Uncharacterized protein n=1 Tax=Mycena alexandri TaxID=1745969 RepID=A0AAD6SKP5_9AGAR|nr:hypothetical protein C8F04DRAFT_1267116 [Mycena alexandri]